MWEATKILVSRLGGAGDMLMTEPTLQALHDKYRPCEITYRSHRHYYDLFLFHPLISNILVTRTGCWTPEPPGYDVYVNLHGAIEEAPFGVHGVDAFARAAGVSLSRRLPKLYLDGDMRPVTSEDDRYPLVTNPRIIPEETGPVVDIALHMPHTPRNKLWLNHSIPKALLDYMDAHGENPTIRIVGIEPVAAGKSNLLRMANAIKRSALFVGPDSGGYHIAAALGVPTLVSLTDDFPASMRGYPTVHVTDDHSLELLFGNALAMYRALKWQK